MLSRLRPLAVTFGPAFLVSLLVFLISVGAPPYITATLGAFILVLGLTAIVQHYAENKTSILFASSSYLCTAAAVAGFSIRIAGKSIAENVSEKAKRCQEPFFDFFGLP